MRNYLSLFSRISFLLFTLSALVYAASLASHDVADLVNGTVSVGVRFILSSLTYIFPFSVFEMLIIISPAILVFSVVFIVKFRKDAVERIRTLISILALIALIFTAYIYTLGVGYRPTLLSERTGIEDARDIEPSELYATVERVIGEMNKLSDEVPFKGGETVMPYSIDEMNRKLIDAYDSMNSRYSILTNFTSGVKPVYFSTVMSDLGISGIYSFFTGETNVNIEYPDYCLPFTAAHELAHQRGISRENEANFVAFLVCISSDDEYIRYSGYLNIYESLASALYRQDKELYYEAVSTLPAAAIADIRAAGEVYDKHKDSILGKINDKLNDAYLKANGTEGVVSYGYVVRLAVGYYRNENNQ